MNSKVENQIECAACTWDKHCVQPPPMTKAEVKEKIMPKVQSEDSSKSSEDRMFGAMLSAMAFAGKDSECPSCPIFIEKLREGPELSSKIKELMKGCK